MPKIFYTGFGDKGDTQLGKEKVRKDNDVINAIGDVDELNSELGVAMQNVSDEKASKQLVYLQNKLFTVGAELASLMDKRFAPKNPISTRDVKQLEIAIDESSAMVPEIKKFILPGGPYGAAYLDRARTVARRAERSVVGLTGSYSINPAVLTYLNRMSSLLFVLARYINRKEGVEELHPEY